MTTSVVGVFTNSEGVERTISALGAVGFDPKEMSVVMRDKKEAGKLGTDTDSEISEGALSGATTGAVVGSFAGLLAGTMIPGLSGFFIAGPVGAILGVSAAVAATLTGGVTGAVAGGLVGALTGIGLSFEEAKLYEGYIEKGSIMLLVPVHEKQAGGVIDMFTQFNAIDSKILTDGDAPAHIKETLSGQDMTEKALYEKPDPDPYQAMMGTKGGSTEEKPH